MSARGFSLVETMVAVSVMMVAVALLGQVVAMAGAAGRTARAVSAAAVLAQQKVEEWRSAGAAPSRSPTDALDVDTQGFCDYLDAWGRGLTGGPPAPPNTAFVRRWSSRALPGTGAVVVDVVAFAWRAEHGRASQSPARPPDQVRLVLVMEGRDR